MYCSNILPFSLTGSKNRKTALNNQNSFFISCLISHFHESWDYFSHRHTHTKSTCHKKRLIQKWNIAIARIFSRQICNTYRLRLHKTLFHNIWIPLRNSEDRQKVNFRGKLFILFKYYIFITVLASQWFLSCLVCHTSNIQYLHFFKVI